MRRISFWLLSTVSALVLLFGYRTSTEGATAIGTTTALPAISSDSTTTAPASTTSGAAPPKKTTKATTRTTTVTGSVAQTQWGPVQVQLTVTGSKITGVSVIQYPNGNPKDAEINGYALPILTRETISAQSATIDMVSGATVTSGGYLQSLQSALDQANP